MDNEQRLTQLQGKIEMEIKKIKLECSNLLKRQEIEFDQERAKMKERIDHRDREIKEKDAEIADTRNSAQMKRKSEV